MIATVTKNGGIAAGFLLALLYACAAQAGDRPTMASVLAESDDADWRAVDPDFTLYMAIPQGTVVIELAPRFAPNAIENIRLLAEADYYSSTAITRSQENYVVQWGDPDAGTDRARTFDTAAKTVSAEFFRDGDGLDFAGIDSRDAYADDVGFVDGFPVGRDTDRKRVWLAHCYGMVGIGRDSDPDSGNGAELYIVTGHAPRHLDRNVVLIGRVLKGMELLTTLPRGTGPLGFYEDRDAQIPIEWIRFASELPEDRRLDLQVMRTDTATFAALVESRRYRAEEWFVDPAGRIGLCNVPVPVRVAE